jgi:putative DNA primase/helicase
VWRNRADLRFEGEAKADCVHGRKWPGCNAKIVATSIPRGAKGYGKYFSGADVVIFPDNDDAGRKYRDEVAAEAYPHTINVRVVELAGLGDKEDIKD